MPASGVPAVLRGLGVLLVLLGLVAMHQLGGGGHMSTMAVQPTSGSSGSQGGTAAAATTHATSQQPMAAQRMPEPASATQPIAEHSLRRVRTFAAAAPGLLNGPPAAAAVSGGIPGGHELMGLMALCLAVLGALLLISVPASSGLALLAAKAGERVVRTRPSPPGRGPPRAMLAQICVLRT